MTKDICGLIFNTEWDIRARESELSLKLLPRCPRMIRRETYNPPTPSLDVQMLSLLILQSNEGDDIDKFRYSECCLDNVLRLEDQGHIMFEPHDPPIPTKGLMSIYYRDACLALSQRATTKKGLLHTFAVL